MSKNPLANILGLKRDDFDAIVEAVEDAIVSGCLAGQDQQIARIREKLAKAESRLPEK